MLDQLVNLGLELHLNFGNDKTLEMMAVILNGTKRKNMTELQHDLLNWFQPTTGGLAMAASRGWKDTQERNEFCYESTQLLWDKVDDFVPRFFRSWFYQIANRAWIDFLRRKRRATNNHKKHSESFSDKDFWAGNPVLMQALRMAWENGFSKEDLDQIASWPLRDQLELLSATMFFSWIPKRRWKKIVRDYVADRQQRDPKFQLPKCFPPATFKGNERELADLLQVPRAQLRKRIHRNKREKQMLAQLPSFKHLLDTYDVD